jgi:hypothetical protein
MSSIMGSRRWFPLLSLSLALALAASCDPARVSPRENGGTGGGGAGVSGAPGGGGAGAGGTGGGGGSFVLPDGGGEPDVAPTNQSCAEEAHRAEIVPVDLMLLLDASGSMTESAGMGNKWQAAQGALSAFVRDPRSAGLGAGLQFYPGGRERPCVNDMDCGAANAGTFYCRLRQACIGPGGPIGASSCGGPNGGGCVAGTTCTSVGRCATSGADCVGIGQPCPGGGGMCETGPRGCQVTFPNSNCDEPGYAVPAVPIAGLPANEMHISRSLLNKTPVGNTPMGPAVRGVLTHLRAHLAANPGHKVALVLVGDGLPGGCGMNDIATIATNLSGAVMGTPSIPTYVIGVFAPDEVATSQPEMDRLAMAGGTTRSILLTSTPDLTQRLQQALDQIRGAAIACEFAIPPAKMGAIDFNRVNVRHTGAAGTDDVLYVETADKCDPTRGGWYYDVPPGQGTPRRILVCDASCRRFKMDAAAKVDLLFGCATRVIQ